MNDPHDMGNRPVAPSVSPLVRQAAWNLHRLELLLMAGTFAWTNSVYYQYFWRTQRMMAVTPEEAAAWLPAVAVTVQRETWIPVLEELTYWPLPEPLPPEAIPWRDALIQSWEQHPAATDWHKSIRLAALVRLDRRAERLPEWLAETRQSLDLEWYHRYFRLAGLAGWRPRPGDRPPHTGSTEVAHGTNSTGAAPAWIRFWEDPVLGRIIQVTGPEQLDGYCGHAPSGGRGLASLRALPGAAAGGVPSTNAATVHFQQ